MDRLKSFSLLSSLSVNLSVASDLPHSYYYLSHYCWSYLYYLIILFRKMSLPFKDYSIIFNYFNKRYNYKFKLYKNCSIYSHSSLSILYNSIRINPWCDHCTTFGFGSFEQEPSQFICLCFIRPLITIHLVVIQPCLRDYPHYPTHIIPEK
jgi:hypothetical protein